MIKKLSLLGFIFSFFITSFAQTEGVAEEKPIEIKGGLRTQKTQKLYWEHGITFDFTAQKLWDKRIHFGLSYFTSRIGSALNSNAIKQDNFLFSPAFHFRHAKQFQPIIKMNFGYFHADYEEEIFDVLQNSSFTYSIEGALNYEFKIPLTISLGAGINFITGNGVDGAGTLYPFFYQFSVYYTFLK